jgi:hypothetical protein
MAKKAKSFFNNRPIIGIGVYIILIYWLVWAIIYFSIDLFIDLYTDLDYSTVFWYTAVAAIPTKLYFHHCRFSSAIAALLAGPKSFGMACTRLCQPYFSYSGGTVIPSTSLNGESKIVKSPN